MDKILSVSISCYNVEEYLYEALIPFTKIRNTDSIEVLIDDNAATDNSLAIARTFEKEYPGLFSCVHTEVNGSWGKPLNKNIKRAKGKYFKILDGDDYFDAEKLDLLIDHLKTADDDLVISGFVFFDSKTKWVIKTFKVHESLLGNSHDIEDVYDRIPLYMHAFTVKTALLRDNGITITENHLYADVEYIGKVIRYARTVSAFDGIVYMYRLGRDGQSISTESFLKHIDEHGDIIYSVLDTAVLCSSDISRKLLYKLANGVDKNHHTMYLLKRPLSAVEKKLRRHNHRIRKAYPDYYEKRKLPRYLNILVHTDFHGTYVILTLRKIKKKIEAHFHKKKKDDKGR